jgi:hypothetical protein
MKAVGGESRFSSVRAAAFARFIKSLAPRDLGLSI